MNEIHDQIRDQYLIEQANLAISAGKLTLPESFLSEKLASDLRDKIQATEEGISLSVQKIEAGGFTVDDKLLEKIKSDREYLNKEIQAGKKSMLGKYIPQRLKIELEDDYTFALAQYGKSGELLSESLNKYPFKLTRLSDTKWQFDEEETEAYVQKAATIHFSNEEKQFINLVNETSLAVVKLLQFEVNNQCVDSNANAAGTFLRNVSGHYTADYLARWNPLHTER